MIATRQSGWGSRAFGALLLVASCSSEDTAPRWVHLADGFVPRTRIAPGDPWLVPGLGGEPLTLDPEEGGWGAWVSASLPAEAWEVAPFGTDVWRARRPLAGLGSPADPERPSQRLASGGAELAFVPYSKKLATQELAPWTFTGVVEFVYLKTAGERPPDCTYITFVERGGPVDGRWRVGLERLHCDGIPLWPGQVEELVVDVPAKSALYFRTAAVGTAPHLGGVAGQITYRVLCDGVELARFDQPIADLVDAEHRVVVLPPERRDGARLRFEASGPAAIGAILDPVLGPAEIGRPGARPWADERPSVLLFLADTFRADNMTAYGSAYEPSLTPRLDRFAERSVVFERAWSPASWTLPSQASMMSGLFPHQHGAGRLTSTIAGDTVVVAEQFARAGYRTGAVTDSLLLSHRYGFDQGFAWFDEMLRDLDDTLEASLEFLDADDGRPLFLWLQTYRTHSPYRASEATRSAYPELGIAGDWDALYAEMTRESAAWSPSEPVPAKLLDVVDRLERLYRGGVVDLDRGFGTLLDRVAERGLDDALWLVFTSDHGEAFGEHDVLFHGNGVWDANVRVPLVVHGPGLAPRRSSVAASLVDLPRTLTGIAGIPSAPRWGGRDLLDGAADEPTFVFECPATGPGGKLAIIDGPRKVLLADSAASVAGAVVEEAYELTGDRAEEHDVLATGAEWPVETARRFARRLAELRTALYEGRRAELRPEDLEQLEALGYVDGQDD